ncbi:SgcJ/EcaC family oxidoreductase [Streptomyces sp. NBC_01727]|uniref:SgcJ/EcaC family oxidoreductase n=1 Tax=Streptomyces sp. NBC_01727 TaxID=2975924 RepID=UPI002E121026|nr:SgcJ/EcaC family oxidoreductase [Streptomyces sp. NBC_01727]
MTSKDQETETTAIRQIVADAQKHQNDPDQFIPLHTADASIVNFMGRRVLGRDALDQAMKRALETPLAKVINTVEIEDIRFIRPDVAIVAGIKHVSDEREISLRDDPSTTLPSLSGWLTYVVVKEQDAWRIVSAQTTPIRN